ncbi:MAG: VirB4 family type IV secretion/conjugal transfer ATPase [Campylobacteraceae bacterium]|jgi:type IV secretion system protein VirB4|nr:VirB4 family type IV secretion/conjugal transfer ATPase [Campylobacteraceae bacterium]
MTEMLFKGMTRPAMILGIPINAFLIVGGFIFLLAVYTNMLVLILFLPAILIMRILTKIDDFIFRLIGLNFYMNWFSTGKFMPAFLSKKYWGGVTAFTAQEYRKLQEQGLPKVTAFDLSQQPSFINLIPYSTHFSDDTIIDKDGNFIAVWKIEGVGFEAEDEDTIMQFSQNLNMIFKAFSTEPVAFYHHNARHDTTVKLKSNFNNSFLKEIDELYYKSFGDGNLKVNSLYFTMVFKPFDSRLKKSAYKKMDYKEKRKELVNNYKQMKEYCLRLESNLAKFYPVRLGTYTQNNQRYSEILSFFSYLISGNFSKVHINNSQIFTYLSGGLNEIIFGKNTIQLNANNGEKKFARIIEIKDYTSETYAGMLDILMLLDVDYTITHSFSLIPRFEAQKAISKQEKQLVSSEDEGLSQLTQLTMAKDELISGDICFGNYHFTLMIFGSSKEDVTKKANSAITAMNDIGFGITLSNLAIISSYFAQLPCNFSIRPRVSLISSKNYASFISFHNFPSGKKDKNCWGDAITTLKSRNGTPYYINFHETKRDRNDFNEKHLGNTLIVGASGSGKTVLQLFLANQMMKYADINTFDDNSEIKNFSMVFFDKDRGAHANVLACGGQYFAIKNGVSTGFNPFMCENTPNNQAFLYSLVKLIVGRELNPLEEDQLNKAITSVLSLPLEFRTRGITRVIEHLPNDMTRDDTLVRRLKNWSYGNNYGWVFDNENDLLSFPPDKNLFGIDGTEFLDEKDVSAPISLYLFWKIENSLIDGRRFVWNIDECWKWIENETVARVVKDKLKTIRKLNGLVEMATQSPEDFLRNDIARAIVEQSATLIFLPNPKAREEDYVQGFNLTKEQFERIKNLSATSRTFLIKKSDETTFVKLDLSSLGSKNLKILSTTKDNWDLIDELEAKGLSGEDFVKEFKAKCV